jgi:hypothetical protein
MKDVRDKYVFNKKESEVLLDKVPSSSSSLWRPMILIILSIAAANPSCALSTLQGQTEHIADEGCVGEERRSSAEQEREGLG